MITTFDARYEEILYLDQGPVIGVQSRDTVIRSLMLFEGKSIAQAEEVIRNLKQEIQGSSDLPMWRGRILMISVYGRQLEWVLLNPHHGNEPHQSAGSTVRCTSSAESDFGGKRSRTDVRVSKLGMSS